MAVKGLTLISSSALTWMTLPIVTVKSPVAVSAAWLLLNMLNKPINKTRLGIILDL